MFSNSKAQNVYFFEFSINIFDLLVFEAISFEDAIFLQEMATWSVILDCQMHVTFLKENNDIFVLFKRGIEAEMFYI